MVFSRSRIVKSSFTIATQWSGGAVRPFARSGQAGRGATGMVLDNVSGAGDRINSAIQAASRTTGTCSDFLLRTAARGSSIDPTAKASTSSARRLFQFIDTTWLAMVKEEGPRYGLAQQASAIDKTASGGLTVSDPAKRAEILKLRDDPNVSALMAGALAGRNSDYLASSMGREPTSGELY